MFPAYIQQFLDKIRHESLKPVDMAAIHIVSITPNTGSYMNIFNMLQIQTYNNQVRIQFLTK
jgi:hypothetical protein